MTTASLHREMVQALENARDYPSGCDCMVDSWTAWERHDWDCVRYVAGVALDGWERRPRLRDDEAFMEMLKGRIFGGPTGLEYLADAIETLLYGERG